MGDGASDIVAGAIDKALLMALCGKRCMLLANGGMVEHAINRISDYVEKSGIVINVGVAGSGNCGE